MDTAKKETWLRKTAAASILPFAALGLAGCGGDTAGHAVIVQVVVV